MTGGVPELVARGSLSGRPLFTPDGESLLVLRSGKVQISSPPGADLKDPPDTLQFPAGILPRCFAPDGSKWLGFGKGKYWIVSYPHGKVRELPSGVHPLAWFPDNRHMLLLSRGALGPGDGVAVWDSETLWTRTIFRSPAATLDAALSPDDVQKASEREARGERAGGDGEVHATGSPAGSRARSRGCPRSRGRGMARSCRRWSRGRPSTRCW